MILRRRHRRVLAAVVATIAVASCASAGPIIVDRAEWGDVFDDVGATGTFAARRVGSDETHVWNRDRAGERRLPGSTFKILNSMIVLETGTLPDVDTTVPWDGEVRDVEVWNRDHDLRSGIEVSAVWMYQDLARRMGPATLAAWVDRAGYGNADTAGEVDRFWLDGALRISPLEQLDFLERMEQGELPFRDDVVDAVREILVRESGDDWRWSHKTGTVLADEPTLGWLVGTTEHDGETWVFALNLDLDGVDGAVGQIDPLVRQDVARRLLVDLGALPA